MRVSPHWLPVLLSTYTAVLLAEVVGDRSFYAIGSLATRLRPLALYAGIISAFGLKMLLAVMAGSALTRLPAPLLRAAGATSLLMAAVIVWRERGEQDEPAAREGVLQSAGLAFSTVFFSEWADPGQLAAAGLSAHYDAPGLVWLAATAALVTKGALAVTTGAGLSRILPRTGRRRLAIASLVALALLVAFGGPG